MKQSGGLKARAFWPLSVLLLLSGFWLVLLLGQPYLSSSQRAIVLQRVQAVQKLQVLEAHLLAHDAWRSEAFLNNNEFVVLAKAKALYSLDLSQAQIHFEGQQARISLPAIQVQELVLNPEELEFLGLKKGLLTSQSDFEQLKRSAVIKLKAELIRQAHDPGLLSQAEANAKSYLESLLSALNHPNSEISFRKLKP